MFFLFGVKGLFSEAFAGFKGSQFLKEISFKLHPGRMTRWWFQWFFMYWLSWSKLGRKIFYVHPSLGKIPILTNIFQMGWDHQLVSFVQIFGQYHHFRFKRHIDLTPSGPGILLEEVELFRDLFAKLKFGISKIPWCDELLLVVGVSAFFLLNIYIIYIYMNIYEWFKIAQLVTFFLVIFFTDPVFICASDFSSHYFHNRG